MRYLGFVDLLALTWTLRFLNLRTPRLHEQERTGVFIVRHMQQLVEFIALLKNLQSHQQIILILRWISSVQNHVKRSHYWGARGLNNKSLISLLITFPNWFKISSQQLLLLSPDGLEGKNPFFILPGLHLHSVGAACAASTAPACLLPPYPSVMSLCDVTLFARGAAAPCHLQLFFFFFFLSLGFKLFCSHLVFTWASAFIQSRCFAAAESSALTFDLLVGHFSFLSVFFFKC